MSVEFTAPWAGISGGWLRGEGISEYVHNFIEAGGHNKEPPPPLCTLSRSNTAHCVDEDAWQASAYFLPKPLGASLPRSSRSLSVPSWRG